MHSPTRPILRKGFAVASASFLALCLTVLSGCGPETVASPSVSTSAAKPAEKPEPAPPTADSQAVEPPAEPTTNESPPADPPVEPTTTPTTPTHDERVASEPDAAPSATSNPPAGKRPTADRTPARPGEAEKITFEDLILGMQADVVFRPFMLTDRARELDGKRVSIMGYIHPGASGEGIKEFVLLRNTECKFGPGGQADHLAQVYLAEGNTTEYQLKPVKVEGTLKIEPFQGPTDGNTWSIYRLENAVVK